MKDRCWWTDGTGGLQVIPRDSLVPASVALPVGGSLFCSRMRGRDMTDTDGVFAQFYEHLRLPDYFGWNWEALRDCLCDLHWISAKHFLIVIEEAEDLLHNDPEERRLFLGILQKAAEYWSYKPRIPLQDKISLATILVSAPEACESLEQEILAAR